MRRVVVTGMGIVSSIGNNADEVTESLRQARSGISFSQDFADHGLQEPGLGRADAGPDRAWSTAAPCGSCRAVAPGTMSP